LLGVSRSVCRVDRGRGDADYGAVIELLVAPERELGATEDVVIGQAGNAIGGWLRGMRG
jgi:hypothetical protein